MSGSHRSLAGRDDVLRGREIILESLAKGPYARTAAIDVATGLEAHAQGPLDAPASYLERLAMQKLARLLEKHFAQARGAAGKSGRWV